MKSQPPSAEVKEGDILAGKYRVDRVIGSGGMGIVVQATHLALKDRVALKFLRFPLQADDETLSRFLREATTAAKIKSPHVARVTDVGTLESGSPYTVMEFLEGEDLGALLKERGAVELEFAMSCLLQACEALASAHTAGVVHRDIKPSNLFITRGPDDSPLLKVLDFGISKLSSLEVSHNLTGSERSMGTPLYMSPEQMRSAKNVDARADIWSLGVVAYELTTGALPFVADNLPVLCSLVLDVDNHPLPPHTLRPEVPVAVSDAILRCLEKDPINRHQNVAEFALALAPFAGELGPSMATRVTRIVSKISTLTPPRETPSSEPTQAFAKSPSTNPTRRAADYSEPEPDVQPAASFDTSTSFGQTQPPGFSRRRLAPFLLVGVAGALGFVGFKFLKTPSSELPAREGTAVASASNVGAPTPSPPVNKTLVEPSVAAVASGSASNNMPPGVTAAPPSIGRNLKPATKSPKPLPMSSSSAHSKPNSTPSAPTDEVLQLRK